MHFNPSWSVDTKDCLFAILNILCFRSYLNKVIVCVLSTTLNKSYMQALIHGIRLLTDAYYIMGGVQNTDFRFFLKTCRFADLRSLRILLKRLNFAQKRNMVSSYNFVRFLLISLILAHLPLYRGFISGEPLTIRKFNYRNLRRQRNLFKFQNFAQKRSHNFVRFSLILQILAHLPIYSSLISCESLKIRKFNH